MSLPTHRKKDLSPLPLPGDSIIYQAEGHAVGQADTSDLVSSCEMIDFMLVMTARDHPG